MNTLVWSPWQRLHQGCHLHQRWVNPLPSSARMFVRVLLVVFDGLPSLPLPVTQERICTRDCTALDLCPMR